MSLSYPGGGNVFNSTTVAADMFLPYSPSAGKVYYPRTSSKEYNPRQLGAAVSPIVFNSNTQVDALVFRLIRNFSTTEGNTNGIEVRAFLYEQDPANPDKPLTLVTPGVLYKKILPINVQTSGGVANPYYSTYPGQQWAVTLDFSAITLQAGKRYFVGAGLREIPGETFGTQMPQVDCHVGTGLAPFSDLGIDYGVAEYFTTPSSWYMDYINYVLENNNFASTTVGATLPYVNNTTTGTALKVGVRTYTQP
jgi:hypothetical protein